jgi:hypothetical protein
MSASSYPPPPEQLPVIPWEDHGRSSLVWTVILFVTGFSIAHRTTQGKAVLAVLLPVVMCCVMGVVFALVAGGLAALFSSQ